MVTVAIKDSKRIERSLEIIGGFVKPSGIKVAQVRNDKGVKYFVQARLDGTGKCGCKSRRTCYHISAVLGADLPTFTQVTAFNLYEVIMLANEALCASEREAPVTVENVYDALLPKALTHSAYGCCGHIVHKKDEGQLCGACFFK